MHFFINENRTNNSNEVKKRLTLVRQGMHIFLIIFLVIVPTLSALVIDGNIVTINNPSDFIELSNNVNSGGITYEGSTVVLGNDIDFAGYSDKFDPVGESETVFFHGSFDGQGHTVNNLVMNTSKQFVGLFGVINGTSFRNVVVDSSCSFVNTYNFTGYFSSVGGVVGYIYPTKGDPEFLVEDCVNMASVTFSGEFDPQSKTRSETIVASAGGVIGYFVPDNSTLTIKNCVNYGEIKFTGCSEFTSLGGIIASSFMMDYYFALDCHIKNCVNYGRLVCTGVTTNMLTLGGITGLSLSGTIENCMDYVVSIINKDTTAFGKIVGTSCNKMNIDNCFWTNESDSNKTCGFEFPSVPKVTNSHIVESNYTTMSVLNEWVGTKEEGEYHKWMMLHLNGGSIANATEETVVALAGFPITDPTKEGHSFVCWCTDDVCSSGEYDTASGSAVSLYAKWKINDYTITFDFGNGTVIEETLTFNTTITYPDVSGLKKFRGWNTSIERMPAYNLVVGESLPIKKSNVGLIMVSVGCVVIVVFIIFIVFALRKIRNISKKKSMLMERLIDRRNERDEDEKAALMRLRDRMRGHIESRVRENYASRERAQDEDEDETDENKESGLSSNYIYLESLYDGYENDPSMVDALTEAGLDRKMIKRIVDACNDIAMDAADDGKLFPNFTESDAAAIAMYTYDLGIEDRAYNPYELIINAFSGEGNADGVRGLLYILMTALRKLPRVKGKTLYRGIRSSLKRDVYKKGSTIVWSSLTSTSPDMKSVKRMLLKDEDDNENEDSYDEKSCVGTLFVIEEGWGYNIQPYSVFPEEEEILLEPERRFQVVSVIQSELTIVNLKMLDTPLVLSRLFGNGSK